MSAMNTEQIRAKLKAMQMELEDLRSHSSQSRSAVQLDQTSVGRVSRIDAIQHQQLALATERSRQQSLAQIASALKRLDDDTYGDCIVCGEKIAPKRLAFAPAVPTCINCAE